MPPRHLLPSSLTVVDVGSASAEQLAQRMSSPRELLLFAPLWAVHGSSLVSALANVNVSLVQRSTHFPHMDTDHLGESVALWTSRQARLVDSFSLGVWATDP